MAGRGQPKTGGRQRGCLNKSTLAERACLALGIDPFDLLARKAMEGDVSCIIQLCKHIEPPRKPVEVLGYEDKTIKVIVSDYCGKAAGS